MRPANPDDRYVPVTAYLTDEVFGYDHWRAAQFESPPRTGEAEPEYVGPVADHKFPALLVVCRDPRERDALRAHLEAIDKLRAQGAGDPMTLRSAPTQAERDAATVERRIYLDELRHDVADVFGEALARVAGDQAFGEQHREVLVLLLQALRRVP